MTIYNADGTVFADIQQDDTSYRLREIKGRNEVYFNFAATVAVDIPIGCYIVLQDGVRYTLEEPPVISKKATRNIGYQAIFSAPQAALDRYRFRNTVDGRLKFCLTAKPHEHLQMLVDNLNLRESGWKMGECVEGAEKLVTYDYSTCAEALDMIATEFETEWEVKDKTISLKKVEYFKNDPLPLSYGKGNGFVSGVGRSNRSDEDSGLEILFAMGGDRNIIPSQNTGGEKVGGGRPTITPIVVDPPIHSGSIPMPMRAASSKAAAANGEVASGNTSLILPRSQELEYEGVVYATDEQGYYVYRKDKPLTSRKEGVLDCAEIYPKRVGEITDVFVANAEKNFYDFTDESIPEDLDYSKCLMEGEKMTVIFQDGMLAGKEFDVKYFHSGRRFEIVPQEIDGVVMPNSIFSPVSGGKYIVFNVKMPDAYVCDNATKTGASWEMFEKAAQYLHEHADYLFTFSGTLDGIWAKKRWSGIKDRLVPGGTVLFSDDQFQKEGVKIRITAIKEYLNDPHRPDIELSNETVGQTYSRRVAALESQEVENAEQSKADRRYTKRTFRDAKETMEALNAALDSFKGEFTEGISPITVNTMQMLVGSEQCQFEFQDDSGNVIDPVLSYSEKDMTFSIGACNLHYLYGDTMSPEVSFTNGKVAAGTSEALDREKPYYVYLRGAFKAGANRTFNLVLSETAKEFNEGYFRYLLVGILDKEMYGNRSWCPMYGYTEITPGRIRVNKIISTDGNTYFDLANNEIGGRINFKDGLVSGLIGVAGSSGTMKAGMNGEGNSDSDIRFWAGADEAGMADAPFRVQQNGNVSLMHAYIFGGGSIYGYMLCGQLNINKNNMYRFFDDFGHIDLARFGGNLYFEDKDSFSHFYGLPGVIYEKNEQHISITNREGLKFAGQYLFISTAPGVINTGDGGMTTYFLSGALLLKGEEKKGATIRSYPIRTTPTVFIYKCVLTHQEQRLVVAWIIKGMYDKDGKALNTELWANESLIP
ncbi:MAG: hypothetical protein NC324_03020 [Bacteroides sp.]|nr:hypothetical protein [Bacteroides sp.]